MTGHEYEVGIPVIDVSSLWDVEETNEYHKTVKAIAEACRDFGFFYIKNHGVEERLRENVFKVMKNFFALPREQKEKIKSKGTGSFRGYFEFRSETTGYLKDDKPDWREGFYASVDIPDDHPSKEMFPSVAQRNRWPDEPTDFRDTTESYYKKMTEVAFKIMSALALGIGLKKDFFDAEFKSYPMAQVGMFHYLPPSNELGPDEITCGEHTDYGILTMLMQDDASGLEIKDETGQWIPAPPIPGTFIVNLGDMLEVWTNGAYKATLHRVRKTQTGKDRLSVAFFFDPNLETVVKPIKLVNTLIPLKNRKPNGNIKVPVTFGEFLVDKYKHTFSQNEQ